jgi:hypothetical protein
MAKATFGTALMNLVDWTKNDIIPCAKIDI